MKIQYLEYSKNTYSNKFGNKSNKKGPKFKKIGIIILILIILGCLGFGAICLKYGFKRVIDKGLTVASNIFSPITHSISMKFASSDVYAGIDKSTSETHMYINDVKREEITLTAIAKNSDVKSIIETESFDRYIDYPNGYYIDLPKDLIYDLTNTLNYTKAYNDDTSITISIEKSPYFDVFNYIEYYECRFFLNEDYKKANNIKINSNEYTTINGKKALVISLTRQTDNLEYPLNTYTYGYMKLYGTTYLRVMVKSTEYTDNTINNCKEILKSFKEIPKQFEANYQLSLFPSINPNWNEYTKKQYVSYQTSTSIDWGIFTTDITNTGINSEIPKIEESIGYEFPIVLLYNHLGADLPLDAMKQIASEGKMIELTVQTCANNNTKLFDYTPVFDIIDGNKDEEIKKLANEIKSFDGTILFRLNNEMNSDWTSYSGVVNLCDPDIYIAVWQRIYKIFNEENVTNCIWIYNPNDNSYPPCKWNHFLAYYPGNECVQMIGITGYNTGTYFFQQNGEVWKEFNEIYTKINEKYLPIFNGFPWIITEFASSSVGGNKAKWITNMFNNIQNFKNIKIAVWFSSADYDDEGNVSRPYWLNETPETTEAFKQGIQKYIQE